jgi:hypothetical protein
MTSQTLMDDFRAPNDNGWTRIPDIEELGVTETHPSFDPVFFLTLQGIPLQLLFRLKVRLWLNAPQQPNDPSDVR